MKVYCISRGSNDDYSIAFISLSKERAIEEIKRRVEGLEEKLDKNFGGEYISYMEPELGLEEYELDKEYDYNEENPEHGYEQRLWKLEERLEQSNNEYWRREREKKSGIDLHVLQTD